ncbi:Ig-like domain-containing protein [Synechococcus sp. Nb3U1]|uniref:Ig-like domain-containing protein n=1 Tax=Synechococcus sp. Nb3U1 TaxID=1914529 RepID=UPI001F20BEFC|nr:Ig-like domain-containing protein [Synechococcus sp. Nb3U1]MCF2972225.1 Ig-like domain-containing protein [Synechococcus sp. Nb3U1]
MLRLDSRYRLWIKLGSLLLSFGLAFGLAWAGLGWTQPQKLSLSVQGQSYPQLVEQARPLVWQALGQQFQAQSQAEQVTLEVLGQAGEQQVPLFTVRMPRSAWQQNLSPSQLEQYSTFYPDALALLQPRAPVQQAQLEFTAPPPTGISLVSSTPSPGQRGIPIDQRIHLRFDQQLPAGLTSLAFGIQPPLEVAFDIQGNDLIFQPLQLLSYSTDYKVLLPASGELDLQKPVELTFRTEPQYTYQRDIKPLLEASCVGCHQQAGRMRRSLLDSYTAVMRYVTPGSATSELLKPRWLARHAVIQRAAGIPLNGGGTTTVDALSLLSEGEGGAEPTPTADPQGESPGSFIGRSGSPELAYIRRNGTSVDRLGHLSPHEIQILRTWIIQDQAAETFSG